MKELQEGTKIAAVSGMGVIEHAVILQKADSENRNVYLVRWLGDGTSTLFEVKEENLIQEGKKRMPKRKKEETILRKAKDQIGRVAVDILAVTLVGSLLLAEKAKEKIKDFIEEQKVDKIPVI